MTKGQLRIPDLTGLEDVTLKTTRRYTIDVVLGDSFQEG